MADSTVRSLFAFWMGGGGGASDYVQPPKDYYQLVITKNRPLKRLSSAIYYSWNQVSLYKFPLYTGKKKMAFVDSIKTGDRHAQEAGEAIVQNMDYDVSNNLIYLGACKNPGAPEDDPVWYIFKYTYDGANRLTKTQLRENVSWTDRGLLGWL